MSTAAILLMALLPLGARGHGDPSGPQPRAGSPESRAHPGVPSQEGPGWTFTLVPSVDLWFHGMATVDPLGPGPDPLYDPAYPTRARREKDGASVGSTSLDRRAGYFRARFRQDPAMEVLHFLPLYFPHAGRADLLRSLDQLAGTTSGIPDGSPSTRFGLTAVGSILTTPDQRVLLGEFVTALQGEWDAFFSASFQESLREREASRLEIQRLWDGGFAPALAPFLKTQKASGGIVFLSPAIGVEGRIFQGNPQEATDNVVVISPPRSGEGPEAALFSALREISFPLARQVLGAGEVNVTRQQEAEALVARGAIRVAAVVLERLLPGELPAYQQFFLSRTGSDQGGSSSLDAAFQEAFPLDAAQVSALRETINNLITDGGKV